MLKVCPYCFILYSFCFCCSSMCGTPHKFLIIFCIAPSRSMPSFMADFSRRYGFLFHLISNFFKHVPFYNKRQDVKCYRVYMTLWWLYDVILVFAMIYYGQNSSTLRVSPWLTLFMRNKVKNSISSIITFPRIGKFLCHITPVYLWVSVFSSITKIYLYGFLYAVLCRKGCRKVRRNMFTVELV